jgi:hypothetical protein
MVWIASLHSWLAGGRGMADLSPAAQAVLGAFCASENGIYLEGDPERLAAALRVAAERSTDLIGDLCHLKTMYAEGVEASADFLKSIATELENTNA